MVIAKATEERASERGRDLKRELLKLSRRAERLADQAEREGDLHAAIAAIREMGRLLSMEANFYPQAVSGKVSIAQVQALIVQYNRGQLPALEPPVEVEALPDDKSI